jgi:hypothetical protein
MRYILEISSRALPGREAEYDRWYGDVHVKDVLALPGFQSAERFRRLGGDGQETGEFVALYTVETDAPADLLQSLFAASATMQLTDSIDPVSPRFEFLAPDRAIA